MPDAQAATCPRCGGQFISSCFAEHESTLLELIRSEADALIRFRLSELNRSLNASAREALPLRFGPIQEGGHPDRSGPTGL